MHLPVHLLASPLLFYGGVAGAKFSTEGKRGLDGSRLDGRFLHFYVPAVP